MKIFSNKKIRHLFFFLFLIVIVFIIFSIVLINLKLEHGDVYVLIGAVMMSLIFCSALFLYFLEQNKIMEQAIMQMNECRFGKKDTRIDCEEEGELYRLFHEVNSLVASLNAYAKQEEEAKHFMKNMISDISHQLKTPLATLNLYNGMMEEEAKEMPIIEEFVSLSEQELDRIETLVQNLLKITKLDAGTIVIEKTMEPMIEIMDCVEKQFVYRAKNEGKRLLFSGDKTVELFCDKTWLIEAIGNLVKNALDHTVSGDKILIEWKTFASIVQIVIKDNGSGIHKEDLYHIFKRFYRSRFSQDTQGVGLGLALVKSIVELHDGTIEVDSELGIGTTFTMSFLIPTKL